MYELLLDSVYLYFILFNYYLYLIFLINKRVYLFYNLIRSPEIIIPGWLIIPSANITFSSEVIRENGITGSALKGSESSVTNSR